MKEGAREVNGLKTVLLIMQRASLAQGVDGENARCPDIQLCYEPDYANADAAIRTHLASGALLEVSENDIYGIDFAWIYVHGCGKLHLIAVLC